MITYTSKEKLFVITAVLCDLFTSIIYAWQRHIYIHKSSVKSPLPPPPRKNPVCNPDYGVHDFSSQSGGIYNSYSTFAKDLWQ